MPVIERSHTAIHVFPKYSHLTDLSLGTDEPLSHHTEFMGVAGALLNCVGLLQTKWLVFFVIISAFLGVNEHNYIMKRMLFRNKAIFSADTTADAKNELREGR